MNGVENLKKLLSFVILPQSILAVILALCFLLNNHLPERATAAVFILEIILNIIIFSYYLKNKEKEKIELKMIYLFLFCFFVIFSFGITFLYMENLHMVILPPPLFYLLFNTITMFYLAAAAIKEADIKKNNEDLFVLIVLCIIIPGGAYIFFEKSSLATLSMVLAIGFLCTLFFLIGKLFYMNYIQNKKTVNSGNTGKNYTGIYRLLVGIAVLILPLTGLFVNNVMFYGALGNFGNIWFYIIAVINAAVLLIDIDKISFKLPVFYVKTAGFAYITYFAVVFAPYFLLGILGILYLGLGLLVFVPALVFFIQSKQLIRDIKILKKQYSKSIIIFTALAGIFTIPSVIAVNFKIDGINFKKAMVYVEDYSDSNIEKEVNINRIKRSIREIEGTMVSSREMTFVSFGQGIPVISTIYRYIALDNNFFTEKTTKKLQKIFIPEKVVSDSEVMNKKITVNKDFEVKISTSNKEYVEESGAYKIWVDMEITLNKGKFGPQEYKTSFMLPDGSFVTDYYLYVGDEQKRGIMTDKRAAQIAYESIIRTPKDPGIIYYDNDNKLALRVFPFPFENSKTRKTGFQIMYTQNGSFVIDGITVNLEAENSADIPIQLDGVQYLPAVYKKSLPKIERTPQYYFLIDAGKGTAYRDHLETIKKYIEKEKLENPVFYSVSYQAEEIKDLKSAGRMVQGKGGFNTANAMGKIFSSVPQGKFPVIILVTENMNRAVEFEKTQSARFFPESEYFYRLNPDMSLVPYDFYSGDVLPKTNKVIINSVVDYYGTAVKDNGESEIVYSSVPGDNQPLNSYREALILQKNAVFSKNSEEQINGIREAMKKRVLTKNTAFIVMETKEQEETLLKLQEKFLKGSSKTPSVMMSEAGWLGVAAVIFIVIFLKKKKS
jgi:hypothetical protein